MIISISNKRTLWQSSVDNWCQFYINPTARDWGNPVKKSLWKSELACRISLWTVIDTVTWVSKSDIQRGAYVSQNANVWAHLSVQNFKADFWNRGTKQPVVTSYSEIWLPCQKTADISLKENLEIQPHMASSTSDLIFRTVRNELRWWRKKQRAKQAAPKSPPGNCRLLFVRRRTELSLN